MKKSIRLLAAIAAMSTAAVGLSACSSGTAADPTPSASSKTSTITVAVLAPGSLQWLQAIADREGFYKAHHVVVKTVQVQTSATLVQAVASGSADAGIAEGNTVMTAIDQGADVIMTGALFQKSALRLYGAKGVDRVADLHGTNVTAGAVSGGTYDLLVYLLKKGGVQSDAITPVAIANSSDRVVALQNGQVKGALLIPPFDAIATSQGATLLSTYPGYYVETPSIVNTKWARSHKAAATGFTQGLADAAKWIYQPKNKAKAIQILASYASVSDSAATAAYRFLIGDKVVSPDLKVPTEGITNMIKISGGNTDGFSISKYYDSSFLTGSR